MGASCAATENAASSSGYSRGCTTSAALSLDGNTLSKAFLASSTRRACRHLRERFWHAVIGGGS